MAFETNKLNNSNINSRILLNNPDASSATNVSPLIFGFNRNAGNGLFVIHEGGSELILDKADVVLNSLYTFSAVLNFDEKTFTFSVSGEKKAAGGGTEAFTWESDIPLAFRKGNNGQYSDSILSFSMTQTSTVLSGYLDEVTIQSIPEPSSVAAMMGGGALLVMALRKRKSHK